MQPIRQANDLLWYANTVLWEYHSKTVCSYYCTVLSYSIVQHTVAMINHESTKVYRQGGHNESVSNRRNKSEGRDQYNNRHIKVRINRRFESHFWISSNRIESIINQYSNRHMKVRIWRFDSHFSLLIESKSNQIKSI